MGKNIFKFLISSKLDFKKALKTIKLMMLLRNLDFLMKSSILTNTVIKIILKIL